MAPRRSSPPAWDWYPPPSPPLPVEGGLRARSRRGAIGESWWSGRFLALLESLGVGGRLDRGRSYARKGQVISLEIEPGRVAAEVQGSRTRPYRVAIAIRRLSEADWRRAEDRMVSRAAFLASLLAGRMPDDIEEAFADGTGELFPTDRDELTATCSCPDPVRPCKHIAAVYYLLAEAFDDDPFLILTWRGRPRDQLLTNLRALRGTEVPVAAPSRDDDPWALVENAEVAPVDAHLEEFWTAGDAITGLRLAPRVPRMADVTIRGLAPLDRHLDGQAVTDLLRPAYEAITTSARDRLLADPGEGAEAADGAGTGG